MTRSVLPLFSPATEFPAPNSLGPLDANPEAPLYYPDSTNQQGST
jgi:hypothetical protein